MQSQKNKNEYAGYLLFKIQNLIKTFKHDNINLNDRDKSIHVDYNKRLDFFVMDSLTRCLNIKKSADKDEVTTHCAVYFKLNFSFDAKIQKIQKVKKLIITSNKNAQKLKQRCKDLFSLIGYEIDDKCLIKKTNIRANFLNVLNFKFSNLSKSLNHCLDKFNLGTQVEFCSDGSEIFEQWEKHMEYFINLINSIDLDEKTKNAYRDSALFYFYLTIFYYFMEDYFCFENTELIIFDPNNTPLYGLHCEIQLISKYLDEIDQNNNYISISSDCCVLCNLVLKNLGFKYYGAKNNMCSSRFWKLPRFDHEIFKCQSDRIDHFYKKLCQDLELVYNFLKDKNYEEDNKMYSEEIPYSDEWIDNQYIYWKRLLKKKVKECSKDISRELQNKSDICQVLANYKIFLSNKLLKNEIWPKINERNKYLEQKMHEVVKSNINFRINSIIEFYYSKEFETYNCLSQEKKKKRKIDETECISKEKAIDGLNSAKEYFMNCKEECNNEINTVLKLITSIESIESKKSRSFIITQVHSNSNDDVKKRKT